MNPPLNISQQQKLLEKVLKERNFGRFSDRLAAVLTDLWLRAGDDAIEAITKALKGGGKFLAKDFQEINEIASELLAEGFAANVSPIVREASLAAYGRGLNEIRAGLSKSFNLIDQKAVQFIHEHHMYWSLNHYDSGVTDRIKRLADTAIKNGLSRNDAGVFFQNTIGAELKRDKAYWELTADAITTRSRSFSNISAFEEAGVERYIISIVDDHRTSDICRYLGGQEITVKSKDGQTRTVQLTEEERTFNVSDAAGVRDKMINAKTPEEAKEIMPWKGVQKRVEQNETASDMARDGVMMPPFHGQCRSSMVLA